MSRLSVFPNLAFSVIFLLAAAAVVAVLLRPPRTQPDAPVEARLRAIVPGADELLVQRIANSWGESGVQAAERHGENGLQVLDAFGDEAAYCLEHRPEAFASLTRALKLDAARFRLANGPWNRAVLDWAQSGKLDRFLQRLQALPAADIALAEANPATLPLICENAAPQVRSQLEKHGGAAWRLFMALNFQDHPADLDRIAAAVEENGDLLLRLNDEFGLPFALLLVPPDTMGPARQFPNIVRHALHTFPDEPAVALAIILTNYQVLRELLDSGQPVEQLTGAIDAFRAQSPFVREVALDHKYTLRLLGETWHGQNVGAEVLRRCGPGAADLVYTRYASEEELRWPALVGLAQVGPTAHEVLSKYRNYAPFYTVLRRSAKLLMDPQENPPAVAHLMNVIAHKGQDRIDVFAKIDNLKGQVLADARGRSPHEAYWEWVPGYPAYRTVTDYRDGRHVTGGDVFWAMVDGVQTASLVYGPVIGGLKQAGGKVGILATERGLVKAEQAALSKVAQGLAASAREVALRALEREAPELGRLGEKAGEFALRRLEARTAGLTGEALGLADRRELYLKLAEAGDINGKARLIEEIGEEGARAYAAHLGYDPLFKGRPGHGMGFDQVYRVGNRIKVLEAKGGGSPLATYRGHPQGSIEYTCEVAEWTLKSPATSVQEKAAAKEVLQAARESRLDVEVVRTEHVQGRPTATRVEQVVGPNGPVQLEVTVAREALFHTPGMASAWVRGSGRVFAGTNLGGWLKQGEGIARLAGLKLWSEGLGPLATRQVERKGIKLTIPVPQLPLAQESTQVSDFAIGLMERGM